MYITRSVRNRSATLPSLWEKTGIIVKVTSRSVHKDHEVYIISMQHLQYVYKSLSIALKNETCMYTDGKIQWWHTNFDLKKIKIKQKKNKRTKQN